MTHNIYKNQYEKLYSLKQKLIWNTPVLNDNQLLRESAAVHTQLRSVNRELSVHLPIPL